VEQLPPVAYSQTGTASANGSQSPAPASAVATNSPAPANAVTTKSPAPASAVTAKSQYKNGTFYGSGSNRRGSIQVAVTIKNDKITDVEISRFAMHYSEDDVALLPQEVIQLQNAQVRNVSGATYSTEAFKGAVQDALTQARNS
jgi:uncharacterized protein with FMN-binding domain